MGRRAPAARRPAQGLASLAGDLLEEYRDRVRPVRGPAGADRWYVAQVLGFVRRAVGPWAALFAAAFLTRTALDWLVPPADFALRAGVTTALALGLLLGAGATAAWRVGAVRAGVFAAPPRRPSPRRSASPARPCCSPSGTILGPWPPSRAAAAWARCSRFPWLAIARSPPVQSRPAAGRPAGGGIVRGIIAARRPETDRDGAGRCGRSSRRGGGAAREPGGPPARLKSPLVYRLNSRPDFGTKVLRRRAHAGCPFRRSVR